MKISGIMLYLSECHKIEIWMMIGYENRTWTQNKIRHLFTEKYPDLIQNIAVFFESQTCRHIVL